VVKNKKDSKSLYEKNLQDWSDDVLKGLQDNSDDVINKEIINDRIISIFCGGKGLKKTPTNFPKPKTNDEFIDFYNYLIKTLQESHYKSTESGFHRRWMHRDKNVIIVGYEELMKELIVDRDISRIELKTELESLLAFMNDIYNLPQIFGQAYTKYLQTRSVSTTLMNFDLFNSSLLNVVNGILYGKYRIFLERRIRKPLQKRSSDETFSELFSGKIIFERVIKALELHDYIIEIEEDKYKWDKSLPKLSTCSYLIRKYFKTKYTTIKGKKYACIVAPFFNIELSESLEKEFQEERMKSNSVKEELFNFLIDLKY
jgi:hypothetical protein